MTKPMSNVQLLFLPVFLITYILPPKLKHGQNKQYMYNIHSEYIQA